MSWKLKILGVRGSVPLSGREFAGFGGNTACVYLDCGEQIFLDAGTGIGTGCSLNPDRPVHILLSHMHLDHIQGLPVFPLLMRSDCEIHIYSEMRGGMSTEAQLDQVFSPPCWPISLRDYASRTVFHDIQPGTDFTIGSLLVHPLRLAHPDQCTGYLLTDTTAGESGLAYLLDCAYGSADPAELACLRGCSAAIMDGFFLPGAEKPHWGHSSWRQCTALAKELSIATPIITHYSPRCTDEALQQQAQLADGCCIFAEEGMTITL